MADYTTVDMVVRSLVDDILRTDAPPAGAVAWAIPDGLGGFEVVALGDLSDPGTGGATIIAQGISLDALRALPGANNVVANLQYECTDDRWNNGDGGTIWVLGLTTEEYWPVGIGLVAGVKQFVTVDVANGTYAPFAGGGPAGTARDPLAVGDVKAITDAVRDTSNTWTDGDLTAYGSAALQDAGAPPAVAGQNNSILVGSADVATMDEFDMPDPGGAGAWRYRYSRRNDGTSGWTRTPKG